jgi:DSF synthase
MNGQQRSYRESARLTEKLGREQSNIPDAGAVARLVPVLGGHARASAPRYGVMQAVPPPSGAPAARRYDELEVPPLDAQDKILWYYMKPKGRPSFTPGLLRDIRELQQWVGHLFAEPWRQGDAPIRYLVLASRMPGIFNLGGDLKLFAERIRNGDRASLERYARACVDVLYPNAVSLDLPIVTIALVQGDALGGGFEAALSCNLIVAERSAKFGLPEILFNLFPGMGAYSFLARRLDAARAEQLIFSGRIYSAEELHEMGVVDVLAEDGRGEEAVREYAGKHARRHSAHRAIYQARQRFHPITYEELKDITDIWVDAALRLTEADLRKMERLAAAQDRRRANAGAITAAAGRANVEEAGLAVAAE